MNYNIDYEVDEEVSLVALKLPARIEEISIGCMGVTYRVAYWNNGERYSVWVSRWEIIKKERKQNEQL